MLPTWCVCRSWKDCPRSPSTRASSWIVSLGAPCWRHCEQDRSGSWADSRPADDRIVDVDGRGTGHDGSGVVVHRPFVGTVCRRVARPDISDVEQLAAVLPDNRLAVEETGLSEKDLDVRPVADRDVLDRLVIRAAAELASMRSFDGQPIPPVEIQVHRAAWAIADLKGPEWVVGCAVARFELKDVPPVGHSIPAGKVVPGAVVSLRNGAALVPAEKPDRGGTRRADGNSGRVTAAVSDFICGARRGRAAVELATAFVRVPLREITGFVIGGPESPRQRHL